MVLIMLNQYYKPARAFAKWMTLGLVLSLTGCHHDKPNVIYMPDMVYSPAIKAQAEGSMRMPVAGTVSRDFAPYPYKDNPEKAAKELKNPVRPTAAILTRGQHVYNTYCIVCHGPGGEGDGSVVPKFPRPPSLQSDKIRTLADGGIYHVITVGQNLMPSYASQIAPGDRWAVIHFVRTLQRSKHPTSADLNLSHQESK
jgi:mono/diheme cytochrome c family protein